MLKLNDIAEDMMIQLALEVFENKDSIYKQAEETCSENGYHPGDNVDEMEDTIYDILLELVKEKLQ